MICALWWWLILAATLAPYAPPPRPPYVTPPTLDTSVLVPLRASANMSMCLTN